MQELERDLVGGRGHRRGAYLAEATPRRDVDRGPPGP
jgi:hypothetical protein